MLKYRISYNTNPYYHINKVIGIVLSFIFCRYRMYPIRQSISGIKDNAFSALLPHPDLLQPPQHAVT